MGLVVPVVPDDGVFRVILSNRWLKLSGVERVVKRVVLFSSSLFPKIFRLLVLPVDGLPIVFLCP